MNPSQKAGMNNIDKPKETHLRIFFAPEAASLVLDSGSSESGESLLELSAEESHHALHVLRIRKGDSIRLFDGKGFFYDARVAKTGRRSVTFRVASRFESRSEPLTRVVLFVSLLKGRKSDFLVQKSVELGVGEIVFFPSVRSVARKNESSKDKGGGAARWEKIVVSACKQSRRATLMGVRLAVSLEEALASAPEKADRYVFWEEMSGDDDSEKGVEESPLDSEGDSPEAGSAARNPFPHGVCAMIGPEGGFTGEEIALVRGAGFRPRSLGRRILRAETAALAAATILLSLSGELGEWPVNGNSCIS